MPSQWIVKRGEKEQGPFTSPQLRQLANAGKLRTTDSIRKEGCEKYVPADKVKGLFDSPPAKPDKAALQETHLMELPVAEVVEVIDEDQPIVLEAVAEEEGSPDDFVEYEYSYDEYPVADYVEYEAPPSSLRRASDQRRSRNRDSGESRRERSATRPAKRKAKKTISEDENGPWQELFFSICSIAIGVALFIAIGPGGVEISGYGLIVWLMMLLNYIGGRWAILVFFVLGGVLGFINAIKKFSER